MGGHHLEVVGWLCDVSISGALDCAWGGGGGALYTQAVVTDPWPAYWLVLCQPWLIRWELLPHYHWLWWNSGPLLRQPQDPHLPWWWWGIFIFYFFFFFARLRICITFGSSRLIPSCRVMCISGGKISQWLRCWRFILRLQILRKQIQQCWFSMMNMYSLRACARGVCHLVWTGDLEHPKRPYSFCEKFRSSLQGRSGDPDGNTRLVGIWASGCCHRCHSLMNFH